MKLPSEPSVIENRRGLISAMNKCLRDPHKLMPRRIPLSLQEVYCEAGSTLKPDVRQRRAACVVRVRRQLTRSGKGQLTRYKGEYRTMKCTQYAQYPLGALAPFGTVLPAIPTNTLWPKKKGMPKST